MGGEKIVQMQLVERLGSACKREYLVGRCRIDIVTEFEIIEIKDIRSWKDAIGQLLYYRAKSGMHDRALRLHLFGNCDEDEWFYITTVCSQVNIRVTREEEADTTPEFCLRLSEFENAINSIDLELKEIRAAIRTLDNKHSGLATAIDYQILRLNKVDIDIEAKIHTMKASLSQPTVDILNKIANSICPD